MKKLILCAVSIAFVSCGAQQTKKVENANVMDYANTITAQELKDHLYTFASDEFEGRDTGEPGQKLAAEYLVNEYKKLNIPSPAGVANYFQPVPSSAFRRGNVKDSENVLAFIEGSEKPEEILVISSHYDHVGMDKDGNVYNGADDDGSGTVAILEIAEAFMQAKADGYHPKRSILLLNVTGEEKGLIGSKWYTDNPVFPLANTVANLNIDMIGRIGHGKEDAGDYVYLIGSDKLSTELHELSEEANRKYINMELDYTYNDENDPNRFYYRSDHYNFAKNNIPIIFYFNGVHDDYHKITDTPDKIEYDLLAKRAQLVFLTAWEIANREGRPVVDKTPEAPQAGR
ncbi:M20/M25/M40 family metallo-hydrolase [Antarcticibacterium flavum]|uniref:M20/M25/M40 family metallo-hydrolase n=1 Tax=Antarcticibacterium flavum TaxID=2058175 RepID=A0A5B7X5K5_9FLAO|nr:MULTISPECIES: M28 family metallopeptidase [Antarcticibacterium]MCM4159800.1 peptidase M28 [Antarcticibacterium sp. W02-3]QCY70726.1 M20/M25/M40 family metallo-hydrolase [Antarcticibacterium flavum]